ncbi:MAG: class I SAM-dependent methyltransferase [Bacteroidota bacterium]
MDTQKAYDHWAETYDVVINKTRDLEGIALREMLSKIEFESVLEIGCGTGKNTEWLVNQASNILSIDLSEEMLAKAKKKITSENVAFGQANITENWSFTENRQFDLICFSLVLEHIENLVPIFEKAEKFLKTGGHLYIGELHPFKQYNGTKARFETESGTQIVDCYNHHISDFVQPALKYGLTLVELSEQFDQNDKTEFPRILTLLFKK